MPSYTPRSGYPYPNASDAPDGPGAVYALATALDAPAWTTFTPTTNINGGSGAAIGAEYQVFNNRVFYNGFFQLGSGFSLGGTITIQLPVAARIGQTYPQGTFVAKKAGGSEIVMGGRFVDATHFRLVAEFVSGNTVQIVDPSPTYPFTWAQTDSAGWSFSYAAN